MAMSQQLVSPRFPYLPVRLEVRGRTHAVDALLDTGFDGDIIVPPLFVSGAETPEGYIPYRLADDSWGIAPTYAGSIHLNNMGSFTVTILTLGDEPIIGLGIISRFAVLLDHGRQVVLEL
jgi:predicted aspartyl protease